MTPVSELATTLSKAIRPPDLTAIERVLISGDLAALTQDQRLAYYNSTCESLGLNPLTRPFDYITLNGKLTLYARKDATEQLRKIHGVSITQLEKTFHEGLYIVTALATDKTGRADASTGAVTITGLKGEALANALMKAETKAKRRVTLSICGLGMLDETEAADVTSQQSTLVIEPVKAPPAGVDARTGEIVEPPALPAGALYISSCEALGGKGKKAGTVTFSDGVKATVWQSDGQLFDLASEICQQAQPVIATLQPGKGDYPPTLKGLKRVSDAVGLKDALQEVLGGPPADWAEYEPKAF